MSTTNQLLMDYFRCLDVSVAFAWPPVDGKLAGFFRFESDLICYARSGVSPSARTANDPLHN